jgi:hypothetical protein
MRVPVPIVFIMTAVSGMAVTILDGAMGAARYDPDRRGAPSIRVFPGSGGGAIGRADGRSLITPLPCPNFAQNNDRI